MIFKAECETVLTFDAELNEVQLLQTDEGGEVSVVWFSPARAKLVASEIIRLVDAKEQGVE